MKSTNLFERLQSFLKRKNTTAEAPEGFCPNCWGRNEYGGQFFDALKNENVDVNNLSEKKGWILDYADKHLLNIQLVREDDVHVCQKCKLTYQPT